MSNTFFKRILKKEKDKLEDNNISSYIAKEIEDIVAKKVNNYKFNFNENAYSEFAQDDDGYEDDYSDYDSELSSYGETPKRKLSDDYYDDNYEEEYYKPKVSKKKVSTSSRDSGYRSSYQNRPTNPSKLIPRPVKYLDEDDDNFLPFSKQEIRPTIRSSQQLSAAVKRTVRPVLDRWLDENLDILIESVLKKKLKALNKRQKPRY